MNKSPLKKLFFFCFAILLLGQHTFAQQGSGQQNIDLILLDTFPNKLPIPELINSDTVLLRIDSTDHVFNPSGIKDSLIAGTYAFNKMGSTTNTILGPSIAWNYQHKVHTEVWNNLPGNRNTTVHWHGAHIPVHTDGGPHQRIPADSTWKIDFDIMDKSATMWYHPHAMDLTYEHVQMGLSGMVYVQDPVDVTDDSILVRLHETLPTAYDTTDFPIIVQTKKFRRNPADTTRWLINRLLGFTTCQPYSKDFNYLVNGVISPYLEVPAQVVRLRVLNGDAKFSFNLGMSEERDNASTNNDSIVPFELIATDAGYTDSTYTYKKILMAPGERTEWLVDFSKHAVGDTVYLANFSSEIPNGILGGKKPRSDKKDNDFFKTNERLLAFVIKSSDTLNPIDTIPFPIALHPLETPVTYDFTKKRLKTFKFGKAVVPAATSLDTSRMTGNIYNINDTAMNMMFVNDVVLLDSTEIWTIDNRSNIAHPWHIHDIHFFVTRLLIRDSIREGETVVRVDTIILTPESDTLQHILRGPLDNVLVQQGWELDFVTTFSDFGTSIAPDSSYMFHCHILPHEDNGMMGQFVVWDGSVIDTTITVSIEELGAKEVDIKLYPNPAYDQLFLEGASTSSSRIRIYDVQGKLLGQGKYPAFDGTISIPVFDLPKGMVFVEWVTKEGRAVKKVILK